MGSTIDVVLTAQDAENRDFSGVTVCVVDVLRATTSIFCALQAGASCILPVEGVEEARRKKIERPDALLCGERHGVPPDGFDMGNSPAELKKVPFGGREAILTTTNGTLAVSHSRDAAEVIAASLLNAKSVARYAAGRGEVCIVCAGTEGMFSIEDFYCAGVIVSELVTTESGAPTDLAWAAAALANRAIESVVNRQTCRHYRTLEAKGFNEDLRVSLTVESSATDGELPILTRDSGGFSLTRREE